MIEIISVPIILALVYAMFLFALSYWMPKFRRYEKLVINLTAGMMFSYMFMTLLPDIFLQDITTDEKVISTFFMFIGYIGFYIAEKRTFTSGKRQHIAEKLLVIRTGGFYIIHFITGYLIVFTFAERELLGAILVLVPFTFHIVATSILYEDMINWVKDSLESRVLFPLLIFVGAVSAVVTETVLGVSLVYFYSFFAGTFIYLMTTILTPNHKKSSLGFFLLGIFLYFVLLVFG